SASRSRAAPTTRRTRSATGCASTTSGRSPSSSATGPKAASSWSTASAGRTRWHRRSRTRCRSERTEMIVRKSPPEIEKIARAGEPVADTTAHVGTAIVPGVTTEELDVVADRFIRERGGVPTSQDYNGYPAAICISPNDVVVHGIPGTYVVGDGDLITIDVGV